MGQVNDRKEALAELYEDTVTLQIDLPKHLVKKLAAHMQNDLVRLSAIDLEEDQDDFVIDPQVLVSLSTGISQLYSLLSDKPAEEEDKKAGGKTRKAPLKKSSVKKPAPQKRDRKIVPAEGK